jgi:clan AA aspartic protease (TIGR02281 family)
MKKIIIYMMFTVMVTGCVTKLSDEQHSQLKKAYTEKNFFKLDNLMSKIEFNKQNPNLLLYKATLDNVFNKPNESIQLINILLDKYPKYFSDSIIRDLYSMRAENAGRLQDYLSAYNDNNFIVKNYYHVCDSFEIASRKDDIEVYHNLSGTPKMELEKSADSRISLKRDIVGLYNVPVSINNDTIDFVFDTGANLSTITKSLATKFGIKLLGDKVNVLTATGKEVKAEMGLLTIRMGNIKLSNVAFFVFPDSLLSFANGAYVIKGVIGFPVMYGFQEFIIKEDKFLIIPEKPEESLNRNFALDALTPVIMVEYRNDTLPFHFDTGATSTDLYSLFFTKYKNEIIGNSKIKNKTFGGAGGYAETEVYILDSLDISAGNSKSKLYSVPITAKDLMGSEVKYIYGNFGQDYIKQYSEMKINFTAMNISFNDKKNK